MSISILGALAITLLIVGQPPIRSDHRKVLLQSLSEAAATAPGWSTREPNFYPEYVEVAEAA